MESIEDKVIQRIKTKPRGTLFFPENFVSLGSSEAIRVALHRLAKSGEIERVSHGIYTRPEKCEIVGKVYPTPDEVAVAIAKRDRARIIPTGAYAMNALGLSTQVPMRTVYLTDGAARLVKVRKSTILFKKTHVRNLSVKGKLSSLVIQALKDIGKDQVTEEEIEKILYFLDKEDPSLLEHDKKLAPAWIAKFFDEALKKKKNDR